MTPDPLDPVAWAEVEGMTAAVLRRPMRPGHRPRAEVAAYRRGYRAQLPPKRTGRPGRPGRVVTVGRGHARVGDRSDWSPAAEAAALTRAAAGIPYALIGAALDPPRSAQAVKNKVCRLRAAERLREARAIVERQGL